MSYVKLSSKKNLILKLKFHKCLGDWGLGIGDWGLGIGPHPQSPIPKIYDNSIINSWSNLK